MTQELLREYVDYDEVTGIVTWKKKTGSNIIGVEVGSYMTNGYKSVGILKESMLVHRLIYLYMTGTLPQQVDHINQVRDDNRWCNIQASTNKKNSRNHTLRSTNTSGWTGVSWGKRENKWRARIMVDGVEKYLGTYYTIEEAVKARKKANLKYGFHENHGKHKEKIYYKFKCPSSYEQ